MTEKVLDIHEKPRPARWVILSLQHMFAMFGSTILVPQLVGLSPAIALLTSGLATIVFVLVTGFKVPAYLGSSFAFIAPIIAATNSGGVGSAMIGSMFVALVYGLVSLLIWTTGPNWIMKLLPPVVVGPVIMVIGLAVAPVAVNMASTVQVGNESVYNLLHFSAAMVTLASAIICLMFFRGVISLMPVIVGIVVGYIYSAFIGILDFAPVKEASWFEIPSFLIPGVDYDFVVTPTLLLIMVPVAIVTISEHIGHQLVLGSVVEKDFIKEPGLNRSLLGDGLGTLVSGLLGGPPKTTYGENIGVMAITKVYSVYVIVGAAVFAILFSFIGKMMAVIQTIPTAVLGGISILLFGIIASSGLRMLVEHKVDFGEQRNLVIASVILVVGIGGAAIKFSDTFEVGGMALAAIVGVSLNLLLPGRTDKTLIEEKE
ncbi:solute carrier family 23 protein [Filibacter tadaridae]|uniref:Uracil permease n=1 Tax=Filibacter tadaridae TaxID=2483811 RepID=A0A3P5XEP0_9BACL|nr:solute carrier family 23 protein [Filibacter tadaridae]VDC29821.1 Uracil permease [Filibacter tadaridae]